MQLQKKIIFFFVIFCIFFFQQNTLFFPSFHSPQFNTSPHKHPHHHITLYINHNFLFTYRQSNNNPAKQTPKKTIFVFKIFEIFEIFEIFAPTQKWSFNLISYPTLH